MLRRILPLALFGLPSAACTGRGAGDTAGVPGIGGGDARFDRIVVIEVDTLRADHLSAYGYARETLPRTMQRPWRVIDGYTAASSWTVPATASALTGLEVHHHGLYDVQDDGAVHPLTAPTLGSLFGAAGRATALFTGNPFLTPDTNMADAFGAALLEPPPDGGAGQTTLNPAIAAWLDAAPAEALVLSQPMDPHQPLHPAAADRGTWARADLAFDEDADADTQAAQIAAAWAAGDDAARAQLVTDLNDVYDEALLGLDRGVDALIGALDDHGGLDGTLVVLTSDHGETLYDDVAETGGTLGHGRSLREELVRLPLMLLAPGLAPDPGEAATPCLSEQVDLLPTLLRFGGVDVPAGLDGRALQDGCRTRTRSALFRDAAVTALSAATARARVTWTCGDGVRRAYDLTADPRGVAGADPATVPDGPSLEADLSAFAAEIEGTWPTFRCVATAPPTR